MSVKPNCKGDILLGTACQRCERCIEQRMEFARLKHIATSGPGDDHAETIRSLVGGFEQYVTNAAERAVASITEPPALIVAYANDPAIVCADVIAPRLQLRWAMSDESRPWDDRFVCHYELVIPLPHQYDIRKEEGATHIVAQLSRTRVGSGRVAPWEQPGQAARTPFRDGMHARWDGEALGLPIFIIRPDGTAERLEPLEGDNAGA